MTFSSTCPLLGVTRSLESQISLVSDLGSKIVAPDAVMLDLIRSQTSHIRQLLQVLEEVLAKRETRFSRDLLKTRLEQEKLEEEVAFLEKKSRNLNMSLMRSTDAVRQRLGLSSHRQESLDDLAELKQKLKDQMAHIHKLREEPAEDEFFDPLAKLIFKKT